MSRFQNYPVGYRAAVGVLFCSAVLFFVGYVTPYWANVDGDIVDVHEGLWMVCVTASISFASETGCTMWGLEDYHAWFHATRILESVALLALIISAIYAGVAFCRHSSSGRHTRALEIIAGLGGILGFVGCMVYAGMRNKESDSSTDTDEVFKDLFSNSKKWNYHFAFYASTLGSVGCMVSAIVIAITNKPLADNQAEGIIHNAVPMGQATPSYPTASGYPAFPTYPSSQVVVVGTSGAAAQVGYPAPQPIPGPFKAGY